MHFAKHTKYASDSFLAAKAKLSPSSTKLSQTCKHPLKHAFFACRMPDTAQVSRHPGIAHIQGCAYFYLKKIHKFFTPVS